MTKFPQAAVFADLLIEEQLVTDGSEPLVPTEITTRTW